MPTISFFYGILIQMFWQDHAPPHFHVKYGEYKATFDIRGLRVLEGKLPTQALRMVTAWAQTHQAELLEDWELCQNLQPPVPIDPLE